MNAWPEIVLLAAGAALSAFFSGAETGAYVLNRLRLRYRAQEDGLAWARRLERLLEDMPIFVTAILIWTNLALDLVSVACTSLYARSGLDVRPELAATLTVAPLLFIFAELMPKSLFRLRSERLMASSARTLSVTVRVVHPIARVFSGLSRSLRSALGLSEPRHWALMSRRAVRTQLAASVGRGGLSAPQRQFIENIMQAGHLPALEAGTPVEEVCALSEESTAGELLSSAAECTGPCALVYRTRRERVVGVVRPIQAWGLAPETRLSGFVSEPVWLDEAASIMQALVALRRAGKTVGIVSSGGREGEEGPCPSTAQRPAFRADRRARALVSEEQLVRHLVGSARA